MKFIRLLVTVLLAISSLLLAFFGVFASVFADGGNAERTATIAIVLVLYFITGFAWSFWLDSRRQWWGLLLGLPAVLILMVYSIREISIFPLALRYALLIMVILLAGIDLAGRLRTKSVGKD